LAKKAKILAIKALSGIGGDVGTVAAAVRYAVDRGAKVINLSLGGPSPLPHPAIVSAMAYAASKNVLVIASAGNGDPQTGLGYSIDEIPFFPAALPDANLVSVASFDSKSVLSPYSNFGKTNVDVVAPGGNMPYDPMFSCAQENPRNALFVGMTGTSMAAPVVSGIAAQVISLRPRLTASEVKAILMSAGPQKPELAAVTGSGRHINALDALALTRERDVLF
jgi:subtilisin family serine protease